MGGFQGQKKFRWTTSRNAAPDYLHHILMCNPPGLRTIGQEMLKERSRFTYRRQEYKEATLALTWFQFSNFSREEMKVKRFGFDGGRSRIGPPLSLMTARLFPAHLGA